MSDTTTEEPRYDNNGTRLCHAHSSRTGKPCRAPAMTGQKVCTKHGGSSPQARRAARQRILELIDPAITRLAQHMEQTDDATISLRAVENILDRAGLPRGVQIDPGDAREILIERLMELRQPAQIETADTIDA